MQQDHFSKFKKRRPFIFMLAIAALFLFPLIVMGLWNAVMPAIFGLTVISYWQSMGLLLLSRILVGGFGGGGGPRRKHSARQSQMQKFMCMSDEERKQFMDEWKKRME